MLFRVQSAAVFGITAYPISVEVDLSSGQKLNLMTVGLPDTAVRESSERVKAALRNCGYPPPPPACFSFRGFPNDGSALPSIAKYVPRSGR